jgi:hypothetical protein
MMEHLSLDGMNKTASLHNLNDIKAAIEQR